MSSDLERFHLNKAVARIRELSNAVAEYRGGGPVLREALETIVLLIGPMTPHLAEGLWRRLGYDDFLCLRPWPEADPALVAEETVVVAVQVNGRKRATIEVATDADAAVVEERALAEPRVRRSIDDKPVRRVVVVPGRIVNVVV